MVTKEDQVKFYEEELKELEFSVKKVFNATGASLFSKGNLYVGQYRGVDFKRGNVFVDIPSGQKYHAPRLDQKLICKTRSVVFLDRKSTRLNSSHVAISYAVFCLKKKNKQQHDSTT